jgi:ABC-2 type transport system ATP-binding protein
MAPAISAKQLAVTFPGRGRQGSVHALRPLDLDLDRGRIISLLGPNGSGKTTLLRVLAGLQPPSSGRVSVLGATPGSKALHGRVAFQPESALPLGALSAREFLAYTGACLGLANADCDARAERWLQRLELGGTGRRQLRTFSTGMHKRLHLCAALLGDPELLLLDEPTSGLDPFGSELVMQILRETSARGATVLMASHHLLEVEAISDEVLILHGGALVRRGSLDELLGSDAQALVLRGLDANGIQALADAARARGGEVLRVERPRDHLFALFRQLGRAHTERAP